MPLTDVAVRSAQPGEKLRKLTDGRGLQLWIMPDGRKYWRVAYRLDGKQKLLSAGVYPEVKLSEARVIRDELRRKLASGEDPSQARKLEKIDRQIAAANSFNALADELIDKKRREKKAASTVDDFAWLFSLARPTLGPRPIAEITAPEVLLTLRKIEARGKLDTAARLRAAIGQVFRYAIATSRAKSDPTAALRGALASATKEHRPAITNPDEFGALLRAVDGYSGTPETIYALRLLALTLVRPGELRGATWDEIDFEAATWAIPAQRMKMRRPHRIPLSRQAIALLRELHMLTGRGRFLFPSAKTPGKPISDSTLAYALRLLGYADRHCPHGYRASGSSMLNESREWSADAIEAALAHQHKDAVRRAYQRSDFFEERIRMMQPWADRLDQLREAAPPLPRP